MALALGEEDTEPVVVFVIDLEVDGDVVPVAELVADAQAPTVESHDTWLSS